jgi:nicotinamide riboside kinase
MKKIALIGPESSGKTSLCLALSKHFSCHWVPEMARTWLEKNGPSYSSEDVEEMARLQVQEEARLEGEARKKNHPYLFCDTNLIVIKIWMEIRFGHCPDWILQEIEKADYALQLLMKPDIGWIPDPLREHPNEQAWIFDRYENELLSSKHNWKTISGSGETRIQNALAALKEPEKSST